jgi:prefoldin subunit 5
MSATSPALHDPSGPAMAGHIRQRLHELREEFRAGQEQLEQLETRQRGLRESLLRIGGAIRVLEELQGA